MLRPMTLAVTQSTQPALLPLPPHPGGVPWPTGPGRVPSSIRASTARRSSACSTTPSARPSPTTSSARMPSSSCSTAPSSPSATAGTSTPIAPSSRGRWPRASPAALVGILVREGKLDISRPIPVKEWAAGDPRRRITIDQMLRMVDGLRFREAEHLGDGSVRYYPEDESDVIPMLFGAGQGRRRRLRRHPALPGRAGERAGTTTAAPATCCRAWCARPSAAARRRCAPS